MTMSSGTLRGSRRRRELFTPPTADVDPDQAVAVVTLPGHAPSIRYDGPVPDIATTAGTPSRRTPQRFDVLSRRFVTFGTATSRPTSQVVLTPPIPSHAWVRGLLVARLHAVDTIPAARALSLAVESVDVSPDDPSLIFVASTIASVTIRSSDVAPRIYRDDFVAPGPCVRVVLSSTCGASTPTGTLRIAVSAQLVGRFS